MRGVCVSLFSCSFHVCGSFSEAFPFRAGLPPPILNYVLREAGSIGLASAKPQLCRRAVPAEAAAGIFARGVGGVFPFTYKDGIFSVWLHENEKIFKKILSVGREGTEIGTVVHVIFTYDVLFCFRESKRKC